jgi:SlyX protein
MEKTTQLEEQIAHLTRTVEEMSDIVARQEKEIAVLTNRVRMLVEREVERQQDQGGHVVLGDERPPHY